MNKTIRKRFAIKQNRRNDGIPISKLTKKYHCCKEFIYWATSKQNLSIKMLRPNSVSKLEPYKEIIEDWIVKRLKRKKGRLQIIALHEYLKETQPDFSCSRTALGYYVARLVQILATKRGSFLTLTHEPHECQADFGVFYYYDANGKETKGDCVALSFPHSGMAYLQVVPGKSTESMLTAMQNIFQHIQCVPREIWFDNDACFVSTQKPKKGAERALVPLFKSFAEYYDFKPVFMSTHAGNEKGSVENALGYLRRNLLVPLPVIHDFDLYNKELLIKSESLFNREHYRKTFRIPDRFAEDKKHFKPLADKLFPCETRCRNIVDRYGCVRIDRTRGYFVDPKYNGKYVNALLTYNRCVITSNDGHVLYDDVRLYRKELQKDIDWSKIFPLLIKHPNTATTLPFVRALPRNVQIFLAMAFPQELKKFIGNFVMIYEMSDMEKAASVADVCARERRIDKENFLKVYDYLFGKHILSNISFST